MTEKKNDNNIWNYCSLDTTCDEDRMKTLNICQRSRKVFKCTANGHQGRIIHRTNEIHTKVAFSKKNPLFADFKGLTFSHLPTSSRSSARRGWWNPKKNSIRKYFGVFVDFVWIWSRVPTSPSGYGLNVDIFTCFLCSPVLDHCTLFGAAVCSASGLWS